MIHPSSEIKSNQIGDGTDIWQFCVILKGAEIGKNCNINANVFIENDVIIGNRVTVKSGVQLWDGLRIEDDVFIGPNATFTNDLNPRSKKYPQSFPKTYIRAFASVGANATIMPGIEIGKFAMIGAGAVVTRSIPERALVVGVPAKIVGWVNDDGTKMNELGDAWLDNEGRKWKLIKGKLEVQ